MIYKVQKVVNTLIGPDNYWIGGQCSDLWLPSGIGL